MTTTDLFSDKSDLYAIARPAYPPALLAFIAAQAPTRAAVWDCGTGNGQAAVALANLFETVQATDLSAEQIRYALPSSRVRYSVQAAERTTFENASFDAVCVAQALHWFDTAKFYPEVNRVLRPDGIFAAWGYSWSAIAPAIDSVVASDILALLAPYWASQNRLLWDNYRDIPFPFDPIVTPTFAIELQWTLDEFIAYVHTWSATRLCVAERGDDCLAGARRRLIEVWGDPALHRSVRMRLAVRIGRRRTGFASALS